MKDEILLILNNNELSNEQKLEELEQYHDSDLADILEELEVKDRLALYKLLPNDKLSEIISYLDEPDVYLEELGIEKAALVLTEMDSDDAAEILEEYDEEEKEEILELVPEEMQQDIDLIDSYDDSLVGSLISTNFITIHNTDTIPQAMDSLISQAKDNDNVNILYVLDKDDKYYGQITLKALFIARRDTVLDTIVETNYPVFLDTDKIDEIYHQIQDYDLPLFPIVNKDKKLLGVFTDTDVIDIIHEEVQEDITRFGGVINEEEDTKLIKKSIKRLPWLITLLVLGTVISTVVGQFEDVIKAIPIVIFFQSLVLNMSGNVGTQSLAVTIRYLSDEKITKRELFKVTLKEVLIGFLNGLILGVISCIVVGLFIFIAKLHITADDSPTTIGMSFLTSGVIGIALVISMTISSLFGSLIPIFFKKIHIDPALASGPFITTINDIVAVLSYYGIAYFLIIVIVLGGA